MIWPTVIAGEILFRAKYFRIREYRTNDSVKVKALMPMYTNHSIVWIS